MGMENTVVVDSGQGRNVLRDVYARLEEAGCNLGVPGSWRGAKNKAIEIGGFRLELLGDGRIVIMSPEGEAGVFPVEVVIEALDQMFADNF